MIENMILMSYPRKSYSVASKGGYVASIQMMSRDRLKHQVRGQFLSRDKLKHQVRGQFLSRDKFILSRDVTFMSHRWLRYTMTAKQVNAAIDVFLI